MKIEIREISLSDINHSLIQAAKNENVSLLQKKSQVIFAAFTESGQMVGICSLVLFSHGHHGLLKSDYVMSEFRRQGIYRQLNSRRIEYAKAMGLKLVYASAYFNAANLLLQSGGVIEKTYKEGYKIKIEL